MRRLSLGVFSTVFGQWRLMKLVREGGNVRQPGNSATVRQPLLPSADTCSGSDARRRRREARYRGLV